MSAPVLLFDLDGTLTDPRAGIVRCMRFALDRLGVPCPADDVLAACIGPPLRGAFATVLDTTDAGAVEEAMRLYREEYAVTGLFENEVYPGVPEMLGGCRAMAGAAFVATSKLEVYAERIVRHFKLDHHFARVYGVDLGGRLDDKADLLAHLLAREGVPAGDAIMVGDRAADVLAARANRVRSIGVLWGYGSEAELRSAGADLLCRAPERLVECLGRLP
jgi:phosphoglycolate phosphatase